MRLVVVHSETGGELLSESNWTEEPPRIGDIIQLGDNAKFKVQEVDWVFDGTPEKHEDVPLKSLTVRALPIAQSSGEVERDPMCACGHRQSIHSPNGCTGRSHTCECLEFRLRA